MNKNSFLYKAIKGQLMDILDREPSDRDIEFEIKAQGHGLLGNKVIRIGTTDQVLAGDEPLESDIRELGYTLEGKYRE